MSCFVLVFVACYAAFGAVQAFNFCNHKGRTHPVNVIFEDECNRCMCRVWGVDSAVCTEIKCNKLVVNPPRCTHNCIASHESIKLKHSLDRLFSSDSGTMDRLFEERGLGGVTAKGGSINSDDNSGFVEREEEGLGGKYGSQEKESLVSARNSRRGFEMDDVGSGNEKMEEVGSGDEEENLTEKEIMSAGNLKGGKRVVKTRRKIRGRAGDRILRHQLDKLMGKKRSRQSGRLNV